MGANYAAQVSKQMPLVDDPASTAYLTELGNTLAKLTERSDLVWHFAIVDSKDVNAFAVPGGYIYVNRGLIERAQTMAQVAGVVGHEIGHVVRRHSVKQMEKEKGASIGYAGLCIVSPQTCRDAGDVISVAANGVFAKFSRDDEAEADAEGVKLLVRAGIDPHGIPQMFRILLDERKQTPGALDTFFASHPLEEDRIAATNALIAQYPAAQLKGMVVDGPRFQEFKQRLQSLPVSKRASKQ
ncbi:MAG: M48 family metalloprotease [Gemmatimonadetes bacterium]|nr:M48 family metalloprotease [Gemmatimonadota bacterium]MBI3568078.1 M48 family metalloprotease [Gemmatimonadota bacterium]